MSQFMWYCQRCGNVGFHSEACIAATSAEKIAAIERESYDKGKTDGAAAERDRLRAALKACGEDWPGEGGWHLLSCDATEPHWPVCEQARAALAAGEVGE